MHRRAPQDVKPPALSHSRCGWGQGRVQVRRCRGVRHQWQFTVPESENSPLVVSRRNWKSALLACRVSLRIP